MSALENSPPPIIEFLGEQAGVGGPFALLGLTYEITSDEQIYQATKRRLTQISRHRHRSTPDADEVRLAVHTAASQLLDHALRKELMRRWPPGVPSSLPKAWRANPNTPRLSSKVIENAKQIVGASGGWNTTARKRLVYFARIKRIPALELIKELRPTRQSDPNPRKKSSPQQALATTNEIVPLVDPPTASRLIWAGAYTVLLVLGASVAITAWYTHHTIIEHTTPRAQEDEGGPSSGALNRSSPLRDEEIQSERTEFAHYTAIAHELDQIVAHTSTDMDGSIDRFEKIYPVFIEKWMAFPPPALDRSSLHIVELARRVAQNPTNADRIIQILQHQLEQTPIDEPEKQMIQSVLISQVISDAGFSSMNRAALASLRQMHIDRLGFEPTRANSISQTLLTVIGLMGTDSKTDSPQWWGRWSKGLRVATANDTNQRGIFVLSALSARLKDESASSQAHPNDGWPKAAQILVNLLPWRQGSPERFWLLRQFAEDGVSTTRLAPITEAIAVHSSAPQVNAQMVLNQTATGKQRQRIAELYKAAWGADQGQSGGRNQPNALANEIHIQVQLTPIATDEPQAIQYTLELASLNAAAWTSDPQTDPSDYKNKIQSAAGIQTAGTELRLGNFDSSRRDSKWANDALSAQDTQALAQLFSQLVQDGGPGINAAYALVYLAINSTQSDIRAVALAQIVRYQDQPAVLLALDHAIGGKRVSSRLGQLISKVVPFPLPERTSQAYFIEAHNQLMALLVDARADSSQSPLTMFETQLASLYSVRINQSGNQSGKESANANEAIQALYHHQLKAASRAVRAANQDQSAVYSIQNHMAIRRARSAGPLQDFLSYQLGIGDLLVLETNAISPANRPALTSILAERDTRLRQAKTIYDQVAQAERAIAQIWIIRLESGTQ